MQQTTDKERRMDDTKLLWHMNRVIECYDKGKRIAPIHIDVGLTKKCNMACVYCYGFYQNMNGAIISKDALLNNIVRSAAKIGVRSLGFIGDGEPTLNPAVYEALNLGKQLGLSLAISTNGILVNDDYKRDAILRSCEWMRFNISAYTKKGYKLIHRSDKREVVLKNIIDMVKYKKKHNLKCDIGLQMVFNPKLMMKEVIPLAQFAIDSGVDYFVIKQCSLPDKGESKIAQFDINLYNNSNVIKILKKAQAMSTNKTKIIPKWNIINLKGEKKYDHCYGVQFLPEISGDGGVYPCAYFFGGNNPKLCYGNVHKNSLEEIFNSKRYWRIVKYMNKKFNPKTQCKGCCRQDKTNEFISEYLNKPKGINFI